MYTTDTSGAQVFNTVCKGILLADIFYLYLPEKASAKAGELTTVIRKPAWRRLLAKAGAPSRKLPVKTARDMVTGL